MWWTHLCLGIPMIRFHFSLLCMKEGMPFDYSPKIMGTTKTSNVLKAASGHWRMGIIPLIYIHFPLVYGSHWENLHGIPFNPFFFFFYLMQWKLSWILIMLIFSSWLAHLLWNPFFKTSPPITLLHCNNLNLTTLFLLCQLRNFSCLLKADGPSPEVS